MKKNRTMKLAAVLLVLTLITSCFVGGTFARYITTNSASDTARVAHWGFAQGTATAMANLFTPDDETAISTTTGGDNALIAPGSSGSETFTFVNADEETNPEVAYRVTFAVTGSPETLSSQLEEALVFSLKLVDSESNVVTNSEKTNLTWPELLTAIRQLSGNTAEDSNGVQKYAPNAEVPAALKNGNSIVVGWAWAWAEDDISNTRDNNLGNKALADLDTLSLTIAVTVEQLNEYSAS